MDGILAQIVQALNSLGITTVGIAGAIWGLYRFRVERANEAALEISISSSCVALVNRYALLSLQIRLKNTGRVKLAAKRKRENGVAYEDRKPGVHQAIEKLQFSCTLELRQIDDAALLQPGTILQWFHHSGALVDVGGQVDLLDEYVNTETDEADFWMEPSESYDLVSHHVVKPGLYLAKVTFVGDRDDEEFWTRISMVNVPSAGEQKQSTTASDCQVQVSA